jgi:hypothetical protein
VRQAILQSELLLEIAEGFYDFDFLIGPQPLPHASEQRTAVRNAFVPDLGCTLWIAAVGCSAAVLQNVERVNTEKRDEQQALLLAPGGHKKPRASSCSRSSSHSKAALMAQWPDADGAHCEGHGPPIASQQRKPPKRASLASRQAMYTNDRAAAAADSGTRASAADTGALADAPHHHPCSGPGGGGGGGGGGGVLQATKRDGYGRFLPRDPDSKANWNPPRSGWKGIGHSGMTWLGTFPSAAKLPGELL